MVQTKGVELAGFDEKPSYRQLVNAGVYVINPQLLPLLPPRQATDMPTLLERAQQAGNRVVVCPIHEYWIDVGRPETLRQAHKEWPAELIYDAATSIPAREVQGHSPQASARSTANPCCIGH